MKCIYTGWFLDPAQLKKALHGRPFHSLSEPVSNPHVTLKFKPQNPDFSVFGSTAGIRVIGYGNDGFNEGLLVEVHTLVPSLQEQLKAVSVPHITLSVAEGAKPVDTGKLHFEPVEPFELEGCFGAFTDIAQVITTAIK